MERDEDLGVGLLPVRIDVDHERSERERHRREHPVPGVELPPVGEVPGKKRQHEQAGAPEKPIRLVAGRLRGQACNLDRNGRRNCESERLEPAAERGTRRLLVTAQDELFPESAAVLACELPGQAVEVAHPLHGDEERLVLAEPGRVQLGDLVAKMILQLLDVVTVDRRGVPDVRTPLRDLCLQALHAHASATAVSSPPEPGHTSFSARVTATHCRC